MSNYRELILLISACIIIFSLGAASLKKAVTDKNRMLCATHLQKLYIATLSYEKEYNSLPPAVIKGKPAWTFWTDCIRKYTDSFLVFCCPSDQRNEKMFEQDNPLFTFKSSKISSYGMNYFLSGNETDTRGGTGNKLKTLSTSSGLILYAESKIPYIKLSRYFEKDAEFRHYDMMNIVFTDGHVELWEKSNFRKSGNSGEKEPDTTFWR